LPKSIASCTGQSSIPQRTYYSRRNAAALRLPSLRFSYLQLWWWIITIVQNAWKCHSSTVAGATTLLDFPTSSVRKVVKTPISKHKNKTIILLYYRVLIFYNIYIRSNYNIMLTLYTIYAYTYNRKFFLWVNWPINKHAFVDSMKALTKNKLTSHGCDADAAICRLTVFLSKNAVYRTCRGCAGKERTCLPGTATIFAYFYNLDNISCTIHNIHTTIIQ
jgi:hypothetical protein